MSHTDIQIGQIAELKTLLKSGTLSDTVTKKLGAIISYYESGSSLDSVAKTVGVTGSALRRWLDQFDPRNISSLEEKSRKPKTLRTSSIDPQVSLLIRQYRVSSPRMGKEDISQKLHDEHMIDASASAIGRIIERDCLYFGDCPLHRRKRFQSQGEQKPSIENVTITQTEHITAVSITAPSRWSMLRKWTVHSLLVALLLCGTILGMMLTTVTRAHAATLGAKLLVNSEAFELIDAGNGSDPIALRFGTSTNFIQFISGVFHFSGGINAPGTISGTTLNANTLLTGSTIQGFGLYNCNGTSNKLTYNSTMKKFLCEADQTGGAGSPEVGTASFSGATLRIGDARYVKKQGDTMTGALTIDVTGGNNATIGLKVVNMISGSTIHAEKSLTSSGTLVWKGNGSGRSLVLSNTLSIGTNHSGSLLTVARVNSGVSLLTASNATLASFDQMSLGQIEGGAVFGRVGLSQNAFSLTNFGQTWTAKESARSWTQVAMSSDGRIQAAGDNNSARLYISRDFGQNWALAPGAHRWSVITMSADGKYMTSAGNTPDTIYTSNDYGNTWTARGSSKGWTGVATSSDGKIRVAVAPNDQPYISTDYGVTWVARGPNKFWKAVAMSSDGRIITAVDYSPGKIYVTYDYGMNWTAKASNADWRSVSMSADGKTMAAVSYGGAIYLSRDYGSTWNTTASSRAWTGISMSAEGKVMTAVVDSGQIYVSSDYGVTWTANGTSQGWTSVAMSSDGRVQTVVGGTQIYVSYADTYQLGALAIGTGGTKNATLNIVGAISGSRLIVSNNASISGALIAQGNITSRSTVSGANLTFMGATSSYILGNLGIGKSGTINTKLEVVGTISGTTLNANTLLTGSTIQGFGLFNCQGSANKLTYNATTKKFLCEADQTGGGPGGTAWSNTGSLMNAFDMRYVKKSGDTMTGSLDIRTALPLLVGSGALNVHQFGSGTGAIIRSLSSVAPALALSINGSSASPHILFGYAGTFDTNLYRSTTNTLKTDGNIRAVGTISGAQLRANNMTVSGAVVYSSGNTLMQSAKGLSGQLLISQATSAPKWATPVGGMIWYLDGTQAVATSKGPQITMPFDIILSSISLKAKGAPTGSALIYDINKDGTTIFATRPQIDASATSGGGSAVFSTTTIEANTVLTLDVDQIGSTFAGSGVTIMLKGIRKY